MAKWAIDKRKAREWNVWLANLGMCFSLAGVAAASKGHDYECSCSLCYEVSCEILDYETLTKGPNNV